MPIGTDTIRGMLKLNGLIDCEFYTSWQDFVAAIPKLFAVEIPNNITNVTIGDQQPSDSERDHLWFRTDSSGAFAGLYMFAQCVWQKIYPVPNQLFFMWGDSRILPPGYTLADADPNINSTELQDMQRIWSVGGTNPTWYSTFHVTYTGF